MPIHFKCMHCHHYPSLQIVIENYHPLLFTSCNQAGLFSSQFLHVIPFKGLRGLVSQATAIAVYTLYSAILKYIPKALFEGVSLPLCKYGSWNRIYWLVTVIGYITIYCFKYTYSHEPVYLVTYYKMSKLCFN